MRFIDTNVLIYAISPAPSASAKQRIALGILSAEELAVSVQVLQEFYFQTTRPNRQNRISHENALAFIQNIQYIRVQDLTLEVFREGVSISRRFKISYWDGAILAAAKISGCVEVYSEDLNHRQDYGGIFVIDPFLQ